MASGPPCPPLAQHIEQPLIDFQHSFGRDVQLPLMAPVEDAGVPILPDAIGRAETVVLLKGGDRALGYTVGSDLLPRPLSPSRLLKAMECSPDTAAAPLPPDTNARVMAAYDGGSPGGGDAHWAGSAAHHGYSPAPLPDPPPARRPGQRWLRTATKPGASACYNRSSWTTYPAPRWPTWARCAAWS